MLLGKSCLTSQFHTQTTIDEEVAEPPVINLRQLDCLAKVSVSVLEECFEKHLPAETAHCLGIIVTHDCSISGALIEKEPYLEVVCAKIIETKDGNLTLGKNPRKLHIQIEHNEQTKWLEINICHREFLPKTAFDRQEKLAEWSFSDKNKGLIRRWLAARYLAPAYPNEYEARLKINKNNERVEKILARVGKDNIDGLFLILDPDQEELPHDQPYELELMLMVKSGLSGVERQEIEKIRDDLVVLLRTLKNNGLHLVGDSESLTAEEAKQLIPIRSDDEITVSEYRQYDQMRLDHLSEGAGIGVNPQRPFTQ